VEAEYLLENSAWGCKPDTLRFFFNKVKVDGGWGEEAIEIGLAHANAEAQSLGGVSQVIIIGDAMANTPDQVIGKRGDSQSGFTEKYWSKTKFSKSTNWKLEIAKLKALNIPVHTFYIPTGDATWTAKTKENFNLISKETGADSYLLNINDVTTGGEELTYLICTQILFNTASSKEAGDELKQAYEKKYPRTYVRPGK